MPRKSLARKPVEKEETTSILNELYMAGSCSLDITKQKEFKKLSEPTRMLLAAVLVGVVKAIHKTTGEPVPEIYKDFEKINRGSKERPDGV
jgi:hypothetical protein